MFSWRFKSLLFLIFEKPNIVHCFIFFVVVFLFLTRIYFPSIALNNKPTSRVLVSQSYPTVCDSVDCSPQGSSVHGILQARTLECIAIPFSRGDWTQISCIASRFFTTWATREAQTPRHKEMYMSQISPFPLEITGRRKEGSQNLSRDDQSLSLWLTRITPSYHRRERCQPRGRAESSEMNKGDCRLGKTWVSSALSPEFRSSFECMSCYSNSPNSGVQ